MRRLTRVAGTELIVKSECLLNSAHFRLHHMRRSLDGKCKVLVRPNLPLDTSEEVKSFYPEWR